MKSIVKTCVFAAAAFFAAFSSAIAQDVNWEEVPFIDIKSVKHSLVPAPPFYGKWACTTVELQAKAPAWAPNSEAFRINNWLNNVKVTLTLAYPKTNTSVSGARARGSSAEKEAALKSSEEAAGTDTEAKYTYYRATATLVGLQIGAGRATPVSFFIPAEIVERESKLSNAMNGQAKPDFYLVEFSYRGNELPVCNPKGALLARNALDFPAGRRPSNMKPPADFVQWVRDNAGSAVSNTRGLLVPFSKMPVSAWPANAPAVVFEDVEQ